MPDKTKGQQAFESRVRLGAFEGTPFGIYSAAVYVHINNVNGPIVAHIIKDGPVANSLLCQGRARNSGAIHTWVDGAELCWKCWKVAQTLPGLKGICFD